MQTSFALENSSYCLEKKRKKNGNNNLQFIRLKTKTNWKGTSKLFGAFLWLTIEYYLEKVTIGCWQ